MLCIDSEIKTKEAIDLDKKSQDIILEPDEKFFEELPEEYRFLMGFCCLDSRYYPKLRKLTPFFTESARFAYQYLYQKALVRTLRDYEIISDDSLQIIEKAISQCDGHQAYEIEGVIGHDMRSEVRTITSKIPDKKIASMVYLGATSFDPISSGLAAQVNAAMRMVIIPDLKKLLKVILQLAWANRNLVCAGRTHGQIAVPTTYGLRFSGFADRLAKSIRIMEGMKVPGKYSGACGTFASAKIGIKNPRQFEIDLLAKMGLEPAMQSTQITQFEYILRLMQEVMNCAGILADFANDLRHLQRSEIGEVGEPIGNLTVGSSTMPHKKNPEKSEQAYGIFKIIQPRVSGFSWDQTSEDERDLSNSITSRTYTEVFLYFYLQVAGMTKVLSKLTIAKANVERNLFAVGDTPLAEAIQQMLALRGYPGDTHEIIRKLTRQMINPAKESLVALVRADPELGPYLENLPPEWDGILNDMHNYIGEAVAITEDIVRHWSAVLDICLD